jgi:RNA polymerase sigma-70 factor (ECF subfamily)
MPPGLEIARRWTARTGETDSLLSDALSRVYERLPQLQSEDALVPWARKILVRCFLDQRRWLSRRPTVQLETTEVATPLGSSADLLDLRSAVAALTREDRALVQLRYWGGMTVIECADYLGIPEGTAKSRLHRVLGQLRHALGEDE